MRTMTRSTAQLDPNTQFDVNDKLSYLLIGGGALTLVLAVVAAITV
ncbi:hypothetical protein [Solicola gregarius]|uniref:Uncharacterized protein n=1 Tax=Solicola gregarius TaxID=2908642 RepID=A0AA46TFT0_9ACTN|nr:hypothetical protein [Solicola gregarius]UYM04516.1 hypothetical protein L0C25_18565 [Solicola gregarius]